MKLIMCPRCDDLFRLFVGEMRECRCGFVRGRYVDHLRAEVSEDAISIALGNGALESAIRNMRQMSRAASRESYVEHARITHAWVRPNTGPANPHTAVLASGIEARSAETSEATARPEGREPGPKDAPESSSEIVP